MPLQRVTKLHSIEVLFPIRAINARWDSFIEENGERITEPTIVRKGYPSEDFDELLPQISDLVTEGYLAMVAETKGLQDQIAALQSSLAEKEALIHQSVAAMQAMEAELAASAAKIFDLEAAAQVAVASADPTV